MASVTLLLPTPAPLSPPSYNWGRECTCRWFSYWWLVFVLLEIDATLSDWWMWDLKILAVSGKWNENVVSVQDFIFCFCVWCKSRELGGRWVQDSLVWPQWWKLLLRPSQSYNKLLDRVTFRILSHVHGGPLLQK